MGLKPSKETLLRLAKSTVGRVFFDRHHCIRTHPLREIRHSARTKVGILTLPHRFQPSLAASRASKPPLVASEPRLEPVSADKCTLSGLPRPCFRLRLPSRSLGRRVSPGLHRNCTNFARSVQTLEHRPRQPAAVTLAASRSARPGPRPVRGPHRGAGRSRHEEPSDSGIAGRGGRRPQGCALPKPPSSGPRARGARTRRRRLYTAEHGGGNLHFVNSSRRNRGAGPVPVSETNRSDGSARRVT